MFWRKEYTPDSGGAGTHRGGLGQTIEIAHRFGADFVVSKMFDRVRFPARGRDGGGDGARGRVFLRAEDGTEQDLPATGRDQVPVGAVLVLQTPGGGGMGKVSAREPERAAADREAGLVSD